MQNQSEPAVPTIALLGVAGFSSLVSMRLCDAMLPALASEFLASTTKTAAVVSYFALTYGVMQLVYGPLGDRFGKPQVIASAAALCALATCAAAIAPTLEALTLARAAMGAGAAAIVPLSLAWIGDTVPIERRQEVLARFGGATVTGIMVGAWAGGYLTQLVGWRAAFAAVVPLFAIVAALLWQRLRSCPAVPPPSPLPYLQQLSALLSPRWAKTVLAAVFVEGVFAFSVLAFVPTVLAARFAMSLSEGGAVLASFAAGGLLFSRSASLLMRHVKAPTQSRIGGVLLGAGFAMLAWMPHWAWAVAGCTVAGFGFYNLHNTLQVNATQLSTSSRGLAVSLFASFFFLGQSAGVPAAAQVFTRYQPAWGFGIAGIALAVLGMTFAHKLQQQGHITESPG